jgi:hypothetical protein
MTEAEQEWGSEVAANEPCSRKGPALDSHSDAFSEKTGGFLSLDSDGSGLTVGLRWQAKGAAKASSVLCLSQSSR